MQIYDYADTNVHLLRRMFEKRLRTYRALGYAQTDGPLHDDARARELTIEYDEDARAHVVDDT